MEPICFLDDLTIKNVIVAEGKLQGIVDFDWVCYGDPLYMIALTQTAVVSDIGEQGMPRGGVMQALGNEARTAGAD